jgi:hypothetical protein
MRRKAMRWVHSITFYQLEEVVSCDNVNEVVRPTHFSVVLSLFNIDVHPRIQTPLMHDISRIFTCQWLKVSVEFCTNVMLLELVLMNPSLVHCCTSQTLNYFPNLTIRQTTPKFIVTAIKFRS